MTNATKALIIAVVNAGFGVALAFNLPLTDVQIGSLLLLVNAALSLVVGLTYKNSPKRVSGS